MLLHSVGKASWCMAASMSKVLDNFPSLGEKIHLYFISSSAFQQETNRDPLEGCSHQTWRNKDWSLSFMYFCNPCFMDAFNKEEHDRRTWSVIISVVLLASVHGVCLLNLDGDLITYDQIMQKTGHCKGFEVHNGDSRSVSHTNIKSGPEKSLFALRKVV